MTQKLSPPARQKRLSLSEWQSAVDLYELGHLNVRQLSEKFGVSKQAISKGLSKRGAIRGRRVAETLIEYEAYLDEKQRRRLELDRETWDRAMARVNSQLVMIDALMELVFEADRNGNLADLKPVVAQFRRALKPGGVGGGASVAVARA